MGEICELLSKLGGVPLSAGTRDGAADPDIAVFAKKIQIATVMEAIWSLFSHRGAEWRWKREEGTNGYEYTLNQPLSARNFPLSFRRVTQQLFEAEALALVRAASMEEGERGHFLNAFARDHFSTNPAIGDELTKDQRLLAGMRLFGEATTPSVQKQILKGEASFLRVAVADLSEKSREYVRKEWEFAKPYSVDPRTGARTPKPEPSFVTFNVRRPGSGEAPSLFIYLEGMGGYGYAGGLPLEGEVRAKLRKRWNLPGDADLSALTVKVDDPNETTGPEAGRPDVIARLRDLAQNAAIPIIVRLPPLGVSRVRRDPGAFADADVQSYLHRLEEDPYNCLLKSRVGALIVAEPAWVFETEYFAPWSHRKTIRGEWQKNSGKLPLRTMAETAHKLVEPQLVQLAAEIPMFGNVARWRDLFQLMHGRPLIRAQVESSRGVPVLEILRGLGVRSAARLELRLDASEAAYLKVVSGRRQQTDTLEFVVTHVDGSDLHRVIWQWPTTMMAD